MGYQLLPPLSNDEYKGLQADIEQHGIQVPIVVTDRGEIVDGHHRAKIAHEIGVPCPREVKAGYTESEYRDMALRLNIHRRNLTKEQRKELHARLRSEGMSVREIAATTGQNRETVRRDVADTNVSPEKVVGKDGKTYPATKPVAKVQTTESVKATEYVDTDTGEVLDESDSTQPLLSAPRTRTPRTDVVAVIGSVMNRAEDAAKAADRLSAEHFRNRQEQAAKWHRDLSPYVQSLTRLLDVLERASE